MACPLIGAKLLFEPMLENCYLDPHEQFYILMMMLMVNNLEGVIVMIMVPIPILIR